MADIEHILEDFEVLDDWEDRYRYVIELGRTLAPLSDAERSADTKVHGCASQVWLVCDSSDGPNGPLLAFRGDSDAHIVRGLVALLIALYSGKTPEAVLATDAKAVFARIGLIEHLTQQRANGLVSMIERIRGTAERVAA